MTPDFSPEGIARLASRIYNESPQSPASSLAEGSPSSLPTPVPGTPPLHNPHGLPAGTPLPALPGYQLPGMSLPNHLPMQAAVPTSLPAQARTFPTPHNNQMLHNHPTSASVPGSPQQGMHSVPATSHGYGSIPQESSLAAFPRHDQQQGIRRFEETTHHGLPSSSPQTIAPSASAGSASLPSSQSNPGLRNFVQRLRQTHLTDRYSSGGTGLNGQGPGPNQHHPLRTTSLFPAHGARPFDVQAIRDDFPILRQEVNGRPLAWFDNAATTQKPQSVIDAISDFYRNDNSNIHRAAHTLAARSTDAYEGARDKVKTFLGASSVKEIVFVRGTTEGINLIANTFGRKFLQPGDEIVLSMLEHHAQIVPWQMIAKERGAVLRVIPVNDRGEIMLEEYQRILGPRTKVVALAHANNSLGTILPIEEMTQAAKRYGARVVIDGAQSVAHVPVNMQTLGADFYVFSGHKIFGPTGIGAVYVKEDLHDFLPAWQGGGNMIRNVTFEETSYNEAPAKFEAGTPNIADAIGLGAALDYVSRIGLPQIAAYEHHLLQYATEKLLGVPGLRLIGTAEQKVGVLSFVLPNHQTEEIGRLLDQEGIAVRSGHHCAQPSLRRFGVETTVRPSLSIYNTCEEIDRLTEALKRIQAQL